MILTGSRAANLSGHLPSWRHGAMCDWDFYGRAEDVERMHAALTAMCGQYEHVTDPIGTVHFLDGKGLRVSIMAWCPVADAILAAPDGFPAEALSLPVTAIGPYGQLALKLGYLHWANAHTEKNRRDCQHWIQTLDPAGWCAEHTRIQLQMQARADEIFTPTQNVRRK